MRPSTVKQRLPNIVFSPRSAPALSASANSTLRTRAAVAGSIATVTGVSGGGPVVREHLGEVSEARLPPDRDVCAHERRGELPLMVQRDASPVLDRQ
jgi:hypothetical protein